MSILPALRRRTLAPLTPLAFAASLAPGCGTTYLQRAAREPGARILRSGVVMRTLRATDGAVPAKGEHVRIAYEGRLVNGKVFVSSPGEELAIDTASPCFRDALTHMHAGEKARVVCDSDLARGESGPKMPDDTTVDFQLELLAPGSSEAGPPLPAGLVIRTLRPGTGERPRPGDTVKVHYEGRLEDGTVFDSSIQTGTPATFPLGNVIDCWRYGLQHMRVGEKAQLTCPPEIAYGAKGSPPMIPPNATLTFEVELLDIVR